MGEVKLMRALIIVLLMSGALAYAGLPPTTTKGSGDTTPKTTFNFEFPNQPITHTGTNATLGILGVAGGGTNAATVAAARNSLGTQQTFNGLDYTAQSDFAITYNEGTRVLAVTYANSPKVWVGGAAFTKAGTDTMALHADTTAMYYYYYNAAGALTQSTTFWDLLTTAPLASVYYNATTKKGILYNERHQATAGMDNATHKYLHLTRGTQTLSGGALSGVTVPSTSAAEISYAIATADLADEDLQITTTALADGGPYRIMYRIGATGVWTWDDTSTTGVLANGTDPYYNQFTGGAWQLTPIAANNLWVNYYVFATLTNAAPQILVVMGQATYGTLALAQAEDQTAITGITSLSSEGVFLYRVTYRRASGVTPTNTRLDAQPQAIRSNVQSTVAGATPNDHGSLSGRSAVASHPATAIATDITNFNGRLTAADDTDQKALDTLDDNVSSIVLGGTGQTSKTAAYDALSPTAAKGSVAVHNGTNNVTLVTGLNGKVLTANSAMATGLEWAPAQSGGIGINLFNTGDAEDSTINGWNTFADGASFVDGSNGTPSSTITNIATTPLRGLRSFLYTSGAQGDGACITVAVQPSDRTRMLRFTGEYSIASGTYPADDLQLWIYDVTNSAAIQPAPYKLPLVSGASNFMAEFQTSATGASYRACFYQATTATYTVKFDTLSVGPTPKILGTPVTDWVSYTPVMSSTGTQPTGQTCTGKYRRVGDSMQVQINCMAGTFTAGSGTYLWSIPTGFSIDFTKSVAGAYGPASASSFIGLRSGATTYNATVTANNATTLNAVYGGGAIFVGATNPVSWASNDIFNLVAEVPIIGWSSSTVMSEGAATRVVAMKAGGFAPTGSLGTAFNTVIYGSVNHDTFSKYNVSTGEYTVPVSGYYAVAASFLVAGTYSAGNRTIMKIYADGSAVDAGSITTAAGAQSPQMVSLSIPSLRLNAGQVVTVRSYVECTGPSFSADPDLNWFSLHRISGPDQIAASESVNAIYNTISSTTITAGVALKFNTKIKDSHGAYTPGTGAFVAPISGVYRFSTSGLYAAVGSGFHLYIGVVDTVLYGAVTAARVTSSIDWPLLAGQSITLVPDGSTTLADTQGTLSISRVGNY